MRDLRFLALFLVGPFVSGCAWLRSQPAREDLANGADNAAAAGMFLCALAHPQDVDQACRTLEQIAPYVAQATALTRGECAREGAGGAGVAIPGVGGAR